ncbi:MAG: FAD-linked oxidase C-terminal domain-containing protein [Gemmatimonadales bacterium]|jgi:glycolate oxidase subunit GlcD
MLPIQAMEALRSTVGTEWVRSARAELDTYASDGLPTHYSRPGSVVIPGCSGEISRVLRILAHFDIPFVARGAGTGLSGGALASEDAVLIVLTRLNRILELDPENRRAVVEPGVVNVALSTAAEPFGLHYAPDPSSQTSCTIGGNVAENAGGPHCLKYGVTSNHILELEVVLPDGEIVTLGSPGGEAWGPDLVGLFVGSEGMFGVATRITVRLTPLPKALHTVLADFDSLRAAGEAVTSIIASGIIPAALEMMDRNCVTIVEASMYRAGYPTDAAAVLLVELDGTDDDAVAAEGRHVEELLQSAGARTVRVAHDPKQREMLWQGRKKAFGALGRLSPDLMVQDAVVPRSALPDVLEQIDEIGKLHNLSICNVFHAGDGNLHPNISFDQANHDVVERVSQASEAIMQVCIEAGGTITGEHGVGIDKLRYMSLVFDPHTLAVMHSVRQAFDPRGLANPGKVLPNHANRATIQREAV